MTDQVSWTDEEWEADLKDPKPPHGWWHGWRCLPYNSDKWISEDRNHQRMNRPRRHNGHHRGHHDRTPAQRFARYDRILYPAKWPRPD